MTRKDIYVVFYYGNEEERTGTRSNGMLVFRPE